MQVSKDAFVILEYRVHLDDGSYVKGEDGPVSLNFVAGYQQVLPSLEQRLMGLVEGTTSAFTIPAAEAFGEYDASQVHVRSFEEFPAGRSLKPGKWIIASNDETQAQYSYFVKDRTDQTVTLDFNHPLAGKDLHYQVKIVAVRPALQEELEYLRPCEHPEETAPPA